MTEARRGFHQRLDDLFDEVMKMGQMATLTVSEARRCFIEQDKKSAQVIMEGDHVFDNLRDMVEEAGLELLATQAPVAVDLRLVVALMRVAQHLERIADLCVDIAKATVNLPAGELPGWMKEAIDEMGRKAADMLRRSLSAFRRRDLEEAKVLDVLDDAVDVLNRGFFKEFDRGREEDLDVAVRVIMVARFFERIADHAVGIGEETAFLWRGRRSLSENGDENYRARDKGLPRNFR